MKFLTLFSLVLFSYSIFGQEPEYKWSGHFKCPNNQSIFTDVDRFGNVFSICTFKDSIDADPTLGVDFKYSVGNNDFFICKQDSLGNYLWSKTIGNIGNDYIINMDIDTSGNLYISGGFDSPVLDLDPGANVSNMSFVPQVQNHFILKLDSAGNFLWANQLLNLFTYPKVKVETTSNTHYIFGSLNDTVDFDLGIGINELFPLTGQVSSFISKYSSAGNLIWAKNFNGSLRNTCTDIDFDISGNVYIKGNFNASVDFDPGPSVNQLTTTVGGNAYEGYVAKLTTSGSFIWAKQIRGNTEDYYQDINVDDYGNCYLVGIMQDSIDLDPSTNDFILQLYNFQDIYACKWDSLGNFVWGGQIVSNSAHFHSSALDEYGNLYIGGDFGDTTDFAPDPNTHLATNDSSNFDLYIAKWSSNGNFLWLYHPNGGQGDEHLFELNVISEDKMVVSGVFSGAGHLNQSSTNFTHTAMGGQDPYMMKLEACSFVSYGSIFDTSCGSYISPSNSYVWTNTGIYSDTLNNYCGGDSVITVNLTIPIFDTTLTVNGFNLSSNMNNVSYQWVDCSNNYSLILGDTNQFFLASTSGNYAVIMENYGCIDTSQCSFVNILEINKKYIFDRIIVYPSPTKDIVNIEFGGELKGEYDLVIHDMLGRVVLEQKNIKTDKISISKENIGKGVFLLNLINNKTRERIFIEKIVVQ